MTATRAPRPRRRRGITMWAGHNLAFFYIPVAVMFLVNDAFGSKPGSPASWPSVVVFAAFAWALACSMVHDRELCERCFRSVPDDPEAEIRRYRRMLRLHHLGWTGFAFAAFAWALKIVLPDLFLRGGPAWAWGADVMLVAAVGAFGFADWQHRRLVRWCPFCDWDDDYGDDDELEPDPDPDPAAAL